MLQIADGPERPKVRVCRDCGRTFPGKSELKAHRKAEHKEKRLETETLTVTGEALQILERIAPARSVADIASAREDHG